ncbi:MAG: hypothetical protein OIF34_08040, partial [Porticoccaceae bacterium]|nr:hypothetical protein [Porticoccaceae bacterium]
LYVDADGELKHTAVGYIDAFALVQEGKRAKGEILTATELEKAYNDGRRDPEFVQSYLLASKPYNRETGEPNEELIKLATDYFDNKKTQDWINEADYTLGSMYFTDRKDRFVQFVFSHHKAFSEVVPKQQLADFIVSANTVSMESSALSGDPAYRQYLEEIKGPLADAYRLSGLDSEMALYAGASASSLEEAHRLYSLIGNKNYALSQSNWAEFWALHEQHVASIDEDIKSIIVHTDIANLTNTDCKDVAALTKAKQHAEKAMENEMDRMSITPTYATILVKLGQKEAAQSVLESAAKEAREIGDPFLQSFIEKAQAKLDQ